MPRPPIVALEVGTTKTRALVAETNEDFSSVITGVGEQPSRGVRKSEVVDFDNSLATVIRALHIAEEQSNVSIAQVYLMLSGPHVQAFVNQGSIPIMNHEREITQHEIDLVDQAARSVNLEQGREVLHTIHQSYRVDRQEGIIDPIGMVGRQLTLSMLIIHGIADRFRNTIKVVQSVPVDVADVAFSGICAALSVLTTEQKESGALVIDLGGGTTDYMVYADKCMAYTGAIAVGGDHVTNDISLGLRLPISQAEQLKKEHGSAMLDFSLGERTISVPPEGGFPGQLVKLKDLHLIINYRMQELFQMIKIKLSAIGYMHKMGSGVILTGAGAYLKDCTKLAENIFNLPCTIGKPRNVGGVRSPTDSAEYAAPIGMVRYAMMSMSERRPSFLGALFKHMFGRK